VNPLSRLEHIHFIGIGGSGMSAIAKVMQEMGYQVSGSDIYEQELTKQLQAQGVKIYLGHQKENVTGADMVVYSSGIPHDNVELLSANDLEIPLLHRSQVLAQLLNQKKGIAITGAHGKTTTSSMITCMMSQAGLDPTFLIGGEVLDFGFNARAGQSDYVIAEADESDGSFLKYDPLHAVITNIEEDHLENYKGNFENLKEAYVQFIHQIKMGGTLVICLDDPIIKELICRDDVRERLFRNQIELLTYGVDSSQATIRAQQVKLLNRSVLFSVLLDNQYIGDIGLSVPGKHNLSNALACIGLGMKLGIPFSVIKRSLSTFVGAKRRFQVLSEAQDIIIVDDYAHHPTEVMATIEASRSTGRKIWAIFQPQRYTRTYYLLDAFSHAFTEADQVIIANIYSPTGEKPIEGVTSLELVQRITKNSNSNVLFLQTHMDIFEHIKHQAKPGDLILTMGAGDIWKVAHQLSKYYQDIEQLTE
jgi:UDP-N-acetylmuramate--alanine ligase